jgi:hypothetical protein
LRSAFFGNFKAALTVDLHEDLVRMPPLMACAQAVNAPLSDRCRDHRPDPMPPETTGLGADTDAALASQQVLDVAEGRREPDVHHHRQADDLGACLEPPEVAGFGPCERLPAPGTAPSWPFLTGPRDWSEFVRRRGCAIPPSQLRELEYRAQ